MSGILISPKHGVNPSVEICFFCGEDKGVILFGRMKGDAEAPRRVCMNQEPCPKCADLMKRGVILIEVRDGEEGKTDPYRMGGFAVVKDEVIPRLIKPPESAAEVLKMLRACFVPHSVWVQIGLPGKEGERA